MNASIHHDHHFDIVMLVLNDIIDDPRVTKEAKALSDDYKVLVLGLLRERRIPLTLQGYTLHPIKVRLRKRGGSSFRYFLGLGEWTIKAISRIVKHKPKVVHAHDLPALPAAYLGGRLCGAKVVYDSHELYTETGGYSRIVLFFWKVLERFLLKRVDLTIVANESRAQIMFREYNAPKVPAVIMNLPEIWEGASAPQGFRQRCWELGLNRKHSFIVLYQGGIGSGRDLDAIIISVKQWPETAGLVLMGNDNDELKELALSLDLEDRVIFYPKVPMTDLIPLASEADMGLVSYATAPRNNYFCAPNKLFEYAAAGIPILGADLPEIRKYVTEYECGLLFKPRDYESIASAIELAVKSPELSKQYRQGAKKMINELNWEKEKERLLNLYKDLLNE